MEFFTLQINKTTSKSFKTLELALEYVKKLDTLDLHLQIFHEEYPDHGHGFEEAHGCKTLVWHTNI